MLYALIVISFLYYLFIPVYAHKVSRGDALVNYTAASIKISCCAQMVCFCLLLIQTAKVAVEHHLALQYFMSSIITIIIGVFINLIMAIYIDDRYIPKMLLKMEVYDRLTKHEYIWIIAILAFVYYIFLYCFYNSFLAYTM